MRIMVRLFLVLSAVILIAIPLIEQPKTATANTRPERDRSAFCRGVVEPARRSGPTTIAAGLLMFAGEPGIADSLPWESTFHRHAVASTSGLRLSMESLNSSALVISGLPAESAPPAARSLPGLAQIVDVSVNNNYFSPQLVRITAGDTVRWTWNGGPHSVTGGECDSNKYADDCAADGSFCSPSNIGCDSNPPSSAGTVYSHQFNAPGTFTYFCNVHLGAMTGTVIVESSTPSGAVQFSASSTSTTETPNATTKVDITVARSGDTSGACTIDYASADGTASERSDYEAALGRLHFDAGQTSKTITAFIVDDSFGESAESFTISLSNPVGCTLGSPATFTVTINSDESVNGANPVKDASFNTDFFVRQHYVDFFNREADASGLGFWKNQIDECVTQECREVRRINVSAAFFLSIEFQLTGYLVYKANQAAFNSAETLKLRDFLSDTQEIGRGVVVGAPNWEQQLEANKQKFFLDFVQRAKFLDAANFPDTLTAAQFVDKLNANTFDPLNPGSGGALTQSERDALVSQLSANPSSASLRAQVLRSVSENGPFTDRQFNKAFVLMQYFGYLRRNPNDPPDMNFDGYNFWLGKLNEFHGNFINAEMVKAFITSGEYQGRFGP